MTLKLEFKNNTGVDGVFFLIGIMDKIYTDPGLTQNAIGNTATECSIPGSPYNCVEAAGGKHTLYFEEQNVTLYLGNENNVSSGVVWFAPAGSKVQTIARGNTEQSIVEMTINSTVVSFDISFVEGISQGLDVTYAPDGGGTVSKVSCNPNQPCNFGDSGFLEVGGTEGFKTILSDKHTAEGDYECNGKTYTAMEMAGCPGAIANDACGQHCCRKYMETSSYEHAGRYCNWMLENSCQGYCWSFDEWTCTDGKCGYDDPLQNWPTLSDCGTFATCAANTFSCGKGTNLECNGTKYWPTSGGCVDKTVNGEATNPQPKRNGGVFSISFNKIPWLENPDPVTSCKAGPVACSQDSDCSAGEVCHEGTCKKLCSQNSDCPPDQMCQGGVCVDRAANTGSSVSLQWWAILLIVLASVLVVGLAIGLGLKYGRKR